MISAVRTTKRRRGFTLIEIVLVLGIASIVMGGAVGMMVFSSDERVLRDASGEIELLAKRARTVAILQQTPYALEFREGIVRMLPLAQAGLDQKGAFRGDNTAEDSTTTENREVQLDDGVALSIRRWNSEKWLGTVKDNVHVWRFDPDGLCEPISVRLALGKSYAQDTFHPLTATSILAEQELEAR